MNDAKVKALQDRIVFLENALVNALRGTTLTEDQLCDSFSNVATKSALHRCSLATPGFHDSIDFIMSVQAAEEGIRCGWPIQIGNLVQLSIPTKR